MCRSCAGHAWSRRGATKRNVTLRKVFIQCSGSVWHLDPASRRSRPRGDSTMRLTQIGAVTALAMLLAAPTLAQTAAPATGAKPAATAPAAPAKAPSTAATPAPTKATAPAPATTTQTGTIDINSASKDELD